MMRTSHFSRDCCCQVMCTVMVIQYHCGQTFSTHLGEGQGPLAQPREDVRGVAPRIFLLTFCAKFSKRIPVVLHGQIFRLIDLTCKRGSVEQSEGLSIPRSPVRFRLNPENSGSELYRPSIKGTKLLLKVIKVTIIINMEFRIKSDGIFLVSSRDKD